MADKRERQVAVFSERISFSGKHSTQIIQSHPHKAKTNARLVLFHGYDFKAMAIEHRGGDAA